MIVLLADDSKLIALPESIGGMTSLTSLSLGKDMMI